MSGYEVEQARCECCDRWFPYLSLKCVRLELPVRRVGRMMVVVQKQIVYRLECPDCREDE